MRVGVELEAHVVVIVAGWTWIGVVAAGQTWVGEEPALWRLE